MRSTGRPLLRNDTRSGYTSFKLGRRMAIGVGWPHGNRKLQVAFKVSREVAARHVIPGLNHEYQAKFDQEVYDIDDANLDLSQFEPLFDAAYRHISSQV
jgi:hypothetical protein